MSERERICIHLRGLSNKLTTCTGVHLIFHAHDIIVHVHVCACMCKHTLYMYMNMHVYSCVHNNTINPSHNVRFAATLHRSQLTTGSSHDHPFSRLQRTALGKVLTCINMVCIN